MSEQQLQACVQLLVTGPALNPVVIEVEDASKVMALDEDDVAEMMSPTGWPLAKMCLVMALPSTL
jgi:hypothetical protein